MGIEVRKFKESYGESFYAIRSIVNEFDPLGLLKLGYSEDEYDFHVCLILMELDQAATVEQIHDVVYSAFFDLYDEAVGKKENYQPMAQRIKDWKQQ